MRTFTSLLAICVLFSMWGTSLSQEADPFGGVDPFGGAGADPFGKSQPKATMKKGMQPAKRQAAQPKTFAAKTVLKRNSSEATLRIRAVLDGKTSGEFIQTPLEEVVSQLSQVHDIPIIIDGRALEEIGLTVDTPVTISLRNVSLRSMLRLILRDLDLTYIVKDEVLQITTAEAADQNRVLEVYTFPDVLVTKSDKVLAAMTASVNPDQWSTIGGPCSASVVDNVLIVSAPESVHEGVIEFLQKLQAAFEKHVAKK